MKYKISWSTLFLLVIVAFSVQGCFGIGENNKKTTTTSSGTQVAVAPNAFKGKFYLTIGHNLEVISGDGSTKELVSTGNVYDPVVSPDGKNVVFIEKFKQYSDLDVVSTSGGSVRTVRSGNGQFYYITSFIHNTFIWYAEPSWSADGSTILFLSDYEKEAWYYYTGIDAPLLDLQSYSVPWNNPSATPTPIAFASYGDGGLRDVSYRPGHSNQIIYTHFAYDATTQTVQQIQLYMEDATMIGSTNCKTKYTTNYKYGTYEYYNCKYYPGAPGGGNDPGIAITPTSDEVIQPAFSPDGNSIAYIKRNATNMSLYVMKAPTDNITDTPNNADTRTTALQSYSSTSQKLLDQQYISEPVWSSNGTQIAYIAYSGNEFDLWISTVKKDANGNYSVTGSAVQVTSGGLDGNIRPVWTAN
jgi:Tol biopolymer transport system component